MSLNVSSSKCRHKFFDEIIKQKLFDIENNHSYMFKNREKNENDDVIKF
jgi:hypothetical protein